MRKMNWKDNFIKFVNKLSKKKGWKCDDMNPYFYQINLLQFQIANKKMLKNGVLENELAR